MQRFAHVTLEPIPIRSGYLVSVAAGVSSAVEPCILPRGSSGGCRRQFRVQRCHSGRQDAVLYGSQDGCRYSRNPAQYSLLAALVFLAWSIGHAGAQDAARENRTVTIEYLAHACFRVTSPSGKQVLIDPYASRVWLGYDFPPGVRADAVLISHPHYDHDGGEAMKRPVPWPPSALVLRQPGTNQIGEITVIGYAGKHADPWGKEFGQINTIWLLRVADLRIVHLGDNGPLSDGMMREFGRVDVLMIPIDSQFHILKADEIAAIRRRLSPSILIPMHYRHDDLESDPGSPKALGGIAGWAKGEASVRYLNSHRHEFSVDTLPKKPEVIIFKHSPLLKPAEPAK